MNCLIIDDNPKTAATLSELLEANPAIGQVHKAVQPYLIRSLMSYETIDIIFIRVRLWEFRQFEELKQKPAIVFLSGGKDKLTEKPGTSVQFSIREPYTATGLSILLDRIKETKSIQGTDFFFLRYSGRFHKTLFSDIDMIERMEKAYVQFHLKYADPLIPGSIPGWIQKLPADRFIRVSDTLILPVETAKTIQTDKYEFKGRPIQLTYRFAAGARKEMKTWPEGL
ncbi:MAG: hypothetical protein V4539_01270 [Bacteroidota bacterium]